MHRSNLVKRLRLYETVQIGETTVGVLKADRRNPPSVVLLIQAPREVAIVQGPNLEKYRKKDTRQQP